MKNPNLSRRSFLKSSLGSVSILIPSMKMGFTQNEIKKKEKEGKIEGDISKWDIDTPALLVDLDAFERNIKKMSEYCKKNNVNYRPHTKTHKCPVMSKIQIAAGAIGICTAKVSEAEAQVDGGLKDILITSPVITPYKIKRLINIRKKDPGLIVVVDNLQNVKDLSEVAVSNKLKLDVIVDINIGQDRTGVEPGKFAVEFVKKLLKSDGLRFRGIQAYSGGMQHVLGFKERNEMNLKAMELAAETKRMIEKEGIELEIFSGGGTGTYNIDHYIPGFTEGQPGSYVFMDVQYLSIGGKDFAGDYYGDFEPSLTILTTAISRPIKDAITVDAGTKALAMERPKPIVKHITGVSYSLSGDEHGKISFENPSREIKIGDKVELIITHCDPAVNLYDYYYCIRNDKVEAIWEITGRGKCQ